MRYRWVKAYRGSRDMAPLMLNLSTKSRTVVNFTPQPLEPPETTTVSTELEAGWAPETVWTFLEKRKSLAPTAIRNPGPCSRYATLLRLPIHMGVEGKCRGLLSQNLSWKREESQEKSALPTESKTGTFRLQSRTTKCERWPFKSDARKQDIRTFCLHMESVRGFILGKSHSFAEDCY